MSDSRLRVGVVTSLPLAAWQARCVEQLAAVPGVTILRWLVQERTPFDPPSDATGPRSAGTVPDALAPLVSIDRAEVTAASESVDVLLDLTAPGVGIPPWAGEVWHFGYGISLTRDAARAAMFDYTRGPGMTRVALIRAGDGTAIREGWLQTLSWWRGELLDHLLADATSWPATAALERIDSDDRRANPSRDDGSPRPRAAATLYDRLPRPVLFAGAVGRWMMGTANSLLRQPDWHIGIIDAPIERMLSADSPLSIAWLPTRPGHFAADPFGLERDGVLHVLFEDYDQALGKGSIHHLSISADGQVSDSEPAVETGVHTSYPFLIEHDGSIFMLPETSAAEELVLYEAERFPSRWRPVATLLRGIPAVDASVVQHEGRWWMFATRVDHGDNHNLFIWHAPELAGPWTPHLANPVKTDIRSSRPGGTPFVIEGTLYRPAQDGSRIYGGQVVIMQVELLTPRAFHERRVVSVAPQPDSPSPDGLHTLSAAGRRTLVDGNAMHMVNDALARTIRRKLRILRSGMNEGSVGR